MKKLNYVTNLSLNTISGGWDGINYRIYDQLSKHFDINLVGPINPPPNIFEKITSKLLRIFGLRGNFFFFSDSRLFLIADIVKNKSNQQIPTFFFGNTSWLKCVPKEPYFLYLDASFPTYLRIYSKEQKFKKSDIKRIYTLEEKWLNSAKHIFWGSNWALEDARKYYNIKNKNMSTIWVGGNIEIPKSQQFSDKLNFTFISLNFLKKGGDHCVEAFKQIKTQYPSSKLTIIGEKPPERFLNVTGVEYAGLLKKNILSDYSHMIKILQDSFFLIHPTKMDTMGAVIIEAGYYGCPTIAPARFGIPELIIDQTTGILLNENFTPTDIYKKLNDLIQDPVKYQLMRENVRTHTIRNLSWDAIGQKMYQTILKNI